MQNNISTNLEKNTVNTHGLERAFAAVGLERVVAFLSYTRKTSCILSGEKPKLDLRKGSLLEQILSTQT
jgi:hypothetical protein